MLLDCTLDSLQLFRDFVFRGFQQTLSNLTAIEIFGYVLLQLNKFKQFSSNIDSMESCPAALLRDIKFLEAAAKSLELQIKLLNMSLKYFRVYPELHRN